MLFPTGAPGYGLGMEYRQFPGTTDAQWEARVRKKLSMRDYAAYRLMTRDSDNDDDPEYQLLVDSLREGSEVRVRVTSPAKRNYRSF